MRIKITDHQVLYGPEGTIRVKLFTGTRHAGDITFEDQPQRRFEFHPETRFAALRFDNSQRAEMLELLRTRPIINIESDGPELTFEGR
jgi:hypothetical protein